MNCPCCGSAETIKGWGPDCAPHLRDRMTCLNCACDWSENARRSPDARPLPPPDGWVNEYGEFTSDMSKVQHPLSVCSWKPVWCELSLLGIPRLERP